ncbi:MAG: response regulator, partial [Aeromonas veronii]
TDAAFCGALVRSLMNVPYRQFQQNESRLLSQPHRLLDYLNHQLMASGLRHSFAMAALLFDQHDGLVFANAGLTSPHWLMRSGGLPLGLMRSSHYALHKRSWHEPFALQFRSDSGGSLDVQVRHH